MLVLNPKGLISRFEVGQVPRAALRPTLPMRPPDHPGETRLRVVVRKERSMIRRFMGVTFETVTRVLARARISGHAIELQSRQLAGTGGGAARQTCCSFDCGTASALRIAHRVHRCE